MGTLRALGCHLDRYVFGLALQVAGNEVLLKCWLINQREHSVRGADQTIKLLRNFLSNVG